MKINEAANSEMLQFVNSLNDTIKDNELSKEFFSESNVADYILPYDKLFEGVKSEWVVALGDGNFPKNAFGMNKNVSTNREKTSLDIRQYRGFKNFLENLDFKSIQKQIILDNTGLLVYKKEIKAPPDGHSHMLTVKVLNSTHLVEDAYREFIKTSQERRGYFSITHSCYGAGLWIGKKIIRPRVLLDSPAPGLIIVIISCESYKYFLDDMIMYLRECNIPKEKLTFFGTSQDVEIVQSNGAFAVLKKTFESILAGKSGLAILRDCDEVYTPVMPSYDINSYMRDPYCIMEMDKDIQKTPIFKGWVGGQVLNLPKKM